MELKLITIKRRLCCARLLIAPLMELKLPITPDCTLCAPSFNRTAYGIET